MCDFCSTDLFSFQTSSPVDIKRLFSCHGSFIPYPCVVNCPTRWSLYCPLGICTPRPSSRLTLWPWSQPCGWSLTNHMADSMIKPQIKTKTMAFVMNNEWVANCDKRAVSLSCFREGKKTLFSLESFPRQNLTKNWGNARKKKFFLQDGFPYFSYKTMYGALLYAYLRSNMFLHLMMTFCDTLC